MEDVKSTVIGREDCGEDQDWAVTGYQMPGQYDEGGEAMLDAGGCSADTEARTTAAW